MPSTTKVMRPSAGACCDRRQEFARPAVPRRAARTWFSHQSGRNSVKQTSSRTALSQSRLLVTNQFIVAAENSRIATSEIVDHPDRLRPGVDADQQHLRIEDEDEGQDRGAQRIERALEAGRDRVLLGDRRRREGREPDRRRDVGHDAEVEHEEVHRDQRDRRARPARRARPRPAPSASRPGCSWRWSGCPCRAPG